MYSLRVSVRPTFEPVSLDYFKAHAHWDTTYDDAVLAGFIVAARELAEAFTGRAFVTQTIEVKFDAFPNSDVIQLPRSPAASVTSLTYVDTAGATQTMAGADYVLDGNSEPARLALAYGKSWPSTRAQMNAITLTYVAGQAQASISDSVRVAICSIAATMSEYREGLVESKAGMPILDLPPIARWLLSPLKLEWV